MASDIKTAKAAETNKTTTTWITKRKHTEHNKILVYLLLILFLLVQSTATQFLCICMLCQLPLMLMLLLLLLYTWSYNYRVYVKFMSGVSIFFLLLLCIELHCNHLWLKLWIAFYGNKIKYEMHSFVSKFKTNNNSSSERKNIILNNQMKRLTKYSLWLRVHLK